MPEAYPAGPPARNPVSVTLPTGDKAMRMHAQTSTIEDGRVHLPIEAPWPDDYLHELTVFPRGKHDDQIESTTQFLDWLNTPMPHAGLFEYYKQEAERLQTAGLVPVYQAAKPEYAIGSIE
jgi:hypothetical protein